MTVPTRLERMIDSFLKKKIEPKQHKIIDKKINTLKIIPEEPEWSSSFKKNNIK
jgi:hypothetical protein